ncbi:hypothetical protein Tco_1421734 [Tanacetum coccineum]
MQWDATNTNTEDLVHWDATNIEDLVQWQDWIRRFLHLIWFSDTLMFLVDKKLKGDGMIRVQVTLSAKLHSSVVIGWLHQLVILMDGNSFIVRLGETVTRFVRSFWLLVWKRRLQSSKAQHVDGEGRGGVKLNMWWPRRKNKRVMFDIWKWPKRKKEVIGCLGKKELVHYWKVNSLCSLPEYVICMVETLTDKHPWLKHKELGLVEHKVSKFYGLQGFLDINVIIFYSTFSDERASKLEELEILISWSHSWKTTFITEEVEVQPELEAKVQP